MTASANLTSVTANYITDSTGGMWTVVPTNTTAGNRVCHNGTVMTNTSNVTQLLYDKNTVYQENTSKNWYKWSGSAWVATTNPLAPAPAVSANGATITTAGPSIVDSASNVWTLVSSASSGLQIALNSVTNTATADVTLLLYYSSTIYQENSAGGWWSWTSGAWVSVSGDPRAAPTGPTGPTAPTGPSGPTAPTGPTGSGTTPTPPSQATAAGYGTLVFKDDFTTTSTIANTQDAASGFNWYWVSEYQPTFNFSTWVQINTTATAASISNGNSGGGSNASPNGGILTLPTGKFPNANLITLPGPAMNDGVVKSLPPLGTGRWQHCYMEAYIQFKPNDNSAVIYTSTGWPAWWSWAAENIGNFGFGGVPITTADGTEVDFVESYGNAEWSGGGSGPANLTNSTIINHGTGASSEMMAITPIDSNWHTYGFLWVPGSISMYYDNVLKGTQSLSGYSLDSQSLFMVLGTGPSWEMNIDWVRVWQ